MVRSILDLECLTFFLFYFYCLKSWVDANELFHFIEVYTEYIISSLAYKENLLIYIHKQWNILLVFITIKKGLNYFRIFDLHCWSPADIHVCQKRPNFASNPNLSNLIVKKVYKETISTYCENKSLPFLFEQIKKPATPEPVSIQ